MKEQDKKRVLTPLEIQQEILGHFADAPTNTPKRLALGDFLFVGEQQESLAEARQEASNPRLDKGGQIKADSLLRVEELKMAHVLDQIKNHRLTVSGYEDSFLKLNKAWKTLTDTSFGQEYRKKDAIGYQSQMDEFVSGLWDIFQGDFR